MGGFSEQLWGCVFHCNCNHSAFSNCTVCVTVELSHCAMCVTVELLHCPVCVTVDFWPCRGCVFPPHPDLWPVPLQPSVLLLGVTLCRML